jgi:UDP-N-acetylglucosamine:LPS N-acetylglucosamine transferase
VYSRVGGGHLSAARALASELEATGRFRARLVDAYVECGRFPVTKFPAAYAQLARHHPRLWSLIYGGTQRGLDPGFVVGPFLRAGLGRLFSAARPDVVVSALPVVNGLLVEAARTTRARVEVVLTDWHSVHPFWVARGVDHYTTPTESARRDCIRFGAPPEVVDVVGIPVRREFSVEVGPAERSRLRQACLSQLGLDPRRFTILALVGAEGSPRALRNLTHLAAADLDAQLVVVCGRSDELRSRVERLQARMPLKALGFVENVADLMRASDVLISKAGGLTLAEAFCCRVPVVIHDVLPGQEVGNVEYVLQCGAVAYAPRPQALVRLITELSADPAGREELAQRGARLARPDAGGVIVRNVLARLGFD